MVRHRPAVFRGVFSGAFSSCASTGFINVDEFQLLHLVGYVVVGGMGSFGSWMGHSPPENS